jgi:hypothetical protein
VKIEVCIYGFARDGSYRGGHMILGNMKSYFFNLSGPIKGKTKDEDSGAFPFCKLG